MTESLYKRKKRWEEASKEDRLMSKLNRFRHKTRVENILQKMTIYSLKCQIRNDSWMLNRLHKDKPEMFDELLRLHDNEIGNSKNKDERRLEFFEKNNLGKFQSTKIQKLIKILGERINDRKTIKKI